MSSSPSRRTALALLAAAGGALLGATPARASAPATAPFGRYGSPARRLTPLTRYVDPLGRGDHATVQAAVDAATGPGHTLVLAPGVHHGTVHVPADRTDLTLLGAGGDPRRTVISHARAAGTPRPDGGTYGTSGSATVTLAAAGFTARDVTFANTWLRADHPGTTGTQAVAVKVQGDRSAFHRCRFLGHQDTLYADSSSLAAEARQYFLDCYVEGDVDFVFGRATAVWDRCHFHTLDRGDLAAAPYGFVFAPSTARARIHGYLATGCRITSAAPDGHYKLARPWVPSSDPTAWPGLVVRETHLGPGIDADAPYGTMSAGHPWQKQRFAEYRNTGPGARVRVPENRPQLSAAQARLHTPDAYLGAWRPGRSD
ncbi:pectinesterase family protein [Streptomyces sp. 549]|uniref:pectinesterase family protein n=1 Tax=Streptomyces sp. 549 TaxID=3049076 RepID=UPI0024C3F8B9|nr:pectinesterase family protein [Streptomyces sp. 549]MDK1473366.1 pectinesterase family protein [Streptomyces sp. 549]